MEATPKLISLHVSPWSERARWALDHHGIAYGIVEHSPVLGERRLRRVVGIAKPKATVPVLLVGREVLTESWDIAAYADRTGHGSKVIVPELEPQIRQWVQRIDDAMQSGRANTPISSHGVTRCTKHTVQRRQGNPGPVRAPAWTCSLRRAVDLS